jgi:hypothetical protein
VQTSLQDHADFIEAVRAVDEYTPHRLGLEGEHGLWAVMLPVMKSNIAVLLQDKAFKELLLELPDLNFRLLAMPDSAAPALERPAKKLKVEVSEDSDEEPNPYLDTSHRRFGRGRTLG